MFKPHFKAKKPVKRALKRYRKDVYDTCAGYDVLRYAKAGYLKVDDDAAKEFMDWYPRNMDYIILRLARKGKLSYKKSSCSSVR